MTNKPDEVETGARGARREMSMREITFKDFAALASKRGHTAESLAERFRGKIEEPREFFERVMSCRWRGEDRSNVVIPYRSVTQGLHYFQDSNAKHRQCACGCGLPVFDRQKWASPGCRQRAARREGHGRAFWGPPSA